MNPSNPDAPLPCESDDEADDALLPPSQRWAYPCKLPSCPDYGKSWLLRSNFLLHLQDREAHAETASTPAERRAIELAWRYMTDPNLPPRAAPLFRSREDPDEEIWTYSFKDRTGRVVTREGTWRQMEVDREKVMDMTKQNRGAGSVE